MERRKREAAIEAVFDIDPDIFSSPLFNTAEEEIAVEYTPVDRGGAE